MKKQHGAVLGLGLAMLFFSVGSQAGDVTISSTKPAVDELDVANLTSTDDAVDKLWVPKRVSWEAFGQAFTTGDDGGLLLSFSTQVSSTRKTRENLVFRLRLITIANDNTTVSALLREETHTFNGTWNPDDWMTWTFEAPVDLEPNKLYGIDVEHTAGGDWREGIPYIRYNRSNDVRGAYRYRRDSDGGVTTINAATGSDRIFHVRIGLPPTYGAAVMMR